MVAVAVMAAIAFWVVTEHWAHVKGPLSFLPYLLFLACPLLHLFMHRGHGHGDGGGQNHG